MAVFTCGVCSIMIVEPAKPGAKVPCPVCGKEMIPRAGPGSLDMGFPDKAARDTAFDFDVPDSVRKIAEERERRKQETAKIPLTDWVERKITEDKERQKRESKK